MPPPIRNLFIGYREVVTNEAACFFTRGPQKPPTINENTVQT